MANSFIVKEGQRERREERAFERDSYRKTKAFGIFTEESRDASKHYMTLADDISTQLFSVISMFWSDHNLADVVSEIIGRRSRRTIRCLVAFDLFCIENQQAAEEYLSRADRAIAVERARAKGEI